MSAVMATIKLSVTRKALACVRREAPAFLPRMLDEQPNGRRHYRFWQRGPGFDRNITTEEAAIAEIAYMHANPVRRGLCEHAKDWKWSSAGDFARKREGPLRIDFGSLPRTYVLGEG